MIFMTGSLIIAVLAGSDAASQATVSASKKNTDKAAVEKKICKDIGHDEIGSRLGKSRVCKTAQEWQLERKRRNGG